MMEFSDRIIYSQEQMMLDLQNNLDKLNVFRYDAGYKQMLGEGFVKINQSCIANTKKILRFSASISGALQVTFKNGYRDYVSRRQLKTVKKRMGL